MPPLRVKGVRLIALHTLQAPQTAHAGRTRIAPLLSPLENRASGCMIFADWLSAGSRGQLPRMLQLGCVRNHYSGRRQLLPTMVVCR